MSDAAGVAAFWKWFEQNQDMLFGFEQDQERIFDRLLERLHAVHPALTFEFSSEEEGRREFIVSADGIKDAFPSVEALHGAAPALPRWTFIKFRPRRSPINRVQMGDMRIDPEDVLCRLLSNGMQLGVHLFFSGVTEQDRSVFERIGFIMLDEALGEFDVETKLGLVRFSAFDAEQDDLIPLPALAAEFDRTFATMQQ